MWLISLIKNQGAQSLSNPLARDSNLTECQRILEEAKLSSSLSHQYIQEVAVNKNLIHLRCLM